MTAVEEKLAKFVAETSVESIPPESFRGAARAAFDYVACTLAGAAQPPGKMMATFIGEQGGKPTSSVIGTNLRTTAYLAALANGTLGHALDYDDMGGFGHPSVCLMPAVLSLGERLGASGRDVLTAYIIGFEAANRMARGSHSPQGITGFHSTSVFGTMAATAAAARMLGLDKQRTLMAFGLAGSMPGGIVQNFGTYTKCLHAGMSARSGVFAASLAKEGWLATDAFITSKVGWAQAYLREGNFNPAVMADGLGETWASAAGTIVKKYPCCGSNHSALDSLLSLIKENKVTLDQVAELEVDNFPAISHVLLYPKPAYGFQGKFSIHYNMAMALVDGKIEIKSHTNEAMGRPQYAEALSKVDVKVISDFDPRYSHGPSENPVTLKLKDGRVLKRSTNRHEMHGTPADPLTDRELQDKFRYCAEQSLPKARIDAALAAWWSVDKAKDVGTLMRAVALDK